MNATEAAIDWLNKTFGKKIDTAVTGTPFSRQLILAIAMQETGYIWAGQYKKKTPDEVLKYCVGDTLDAPNRSAFPKTRAELEAKKDGKAMFKVAREALELLATINGTYAKVAKKKDKFCHGFGLLQYDLQSFLVDPDFFLKKKWATIDGTLEKCVSELKDKIKVVYGPNKKKLTHDESVYVAIAYNKGSADTKKGFKQGYKSGTKYYGENIDAYLTVAEHVAP